MFPFRIMSLVYTGLISAGIVGALWALDEYGDRRVERARVAWRAETDAEKQAEREAAAKAGEEAEAARLAALRPGSAGRLREFWCRDCEVGQ